MIEHLENLEPIEQFSSPSANIIESQMANVYGHGSTANAARQGQIIDDAQDRVHINTGFVYRDIENSIQSFSGDDHIQIGRWVENFEDTAEMMQWNQIQKLVYGKRALTGTASHVVQVERCRSWDALKQTLLSEFGGSLNSAELHALLSSSKHNSNESFLSYIVRMREIASQGTVDTAAQIHYIVNGINDKTEKKLLLYGAKNFKELKKKFKIYESVVKEHQEEQKTTTKKNEFTKC